MYLAQKCGWDKDFIAERFTIGQLRMYFEILNKIDLSDTKRMSIAFRASQMEQNDFERFLDDGKGDNVSDKKSFDKMKDLGLPIEEN